MPGLSNIKDNYVSIIFVHHAQNEERSLLARASLKSLEGTIHSSAEIIVVDNGGNLEDSKFFLTECDKKNIALYIRNADNMYFSWARNQAIMNITANWVAIVDDDIMYKDHWLEWCLTMLRAHPDKKFIASPINYPYVHKRDHRWRHGQIPVKRRQCNLTERAGSNCMVMRRSVLEEVGLFDLRRKAGGLYVDRLIRAGYLVITPEVNWAYDCGLRRGFNFKKPYSVDRTLSNGDKINFTHFPKCPKLP